MRKYVITFHTHFHSLVCMRTLKKNEKENKLFNIKMIPVPRSLSSSCGTAIEIESENFDLKFIETVEYDELFELDGNEEYIKIKR